MLEIDIGRVANLIFKRDDAEAEGVRATDELAVDVDSAGVRVLRCNIDIDANGQLANVTHGPTRLTDLEVAE